MPTRSKRRPGPDPAATATGEPAAGTATPPPRAGAIDPAAIARLADLRQRSVMAIGEVVLVLAATPRYRDQTLEDLRSLVFEPMVRDRIAIASVRPPRDASQLFLPMTGIAIWASVSEEIDLRLRAQVKAGVFPLRLKPGDWASGDINWLIDVIAPTRQLATAVVAQFRKLATGPRVSVHPIVAQQLEPETLAQLIGQAMSSGPPRARAEPGTVGPTK